MGRRDDLGAALLAAHPRGEQWRELDVTVSAMTFDQVEALAAGIALGGDDDVARWRVRTEVVAGLVGTELEGRLGSRWVRWCSTFGLEPPPLDRTSSCVLMHPYWLAERAAGDREHQLWARFVSGLTAVFDAALGVAATDPGPAERAAHDTLTAVWSRVCLPCRFGPGDVFGPGHRAAMGLMRSAAALPRPELDAVIERRRELGNPSWRRVRQQVTERSVDVGFPFRGEGLYWEAVAAAEDAAGESPTDPALADALWGAAAAVVFADGLTAPVIEVLTTPWGRPPHPVPR